VLGTFKCYVDPVIDCTRTVTNVTGVTNPWHLIIGSDKPTMVATLYDLYGDPYEGELVTFTKTTGPLKKRELEE